MRKAVLVAAVAALAMLAVAGCAGAGGRTAVPLGQPVTLAPGQAVEISGEDLRIRFLEVVTDSRCPTGAT